MDKARPDIGLMLLEALPADFEADFDELNTPEVTAATLRRSGGPYNGVELYLPAAVGLFVASSYFGGALKKAGEEHYLALRAVAKRLWKESSKLT